MNYNICCLIYLFVLITNEQPAHSQSILVGNVTVYELPTASYQAELIDSLQTKRSVLSTAVYEGGNKLTRAVVEEKFRNSPQILKKVHVANILKPLGPLIVASGLFVGYIGIKGVQATDVVRGLRPPGVNEVPDVSVNYTKRSLPKLLSGLGLFIAGICLIELSNEMTAKSIVLYNNKLKSLATKRPSYFTTIKFGITSNGGLGLESKF